MARRNVHRIDDALIRAGYLFALVSLTASGCSGRLGAGQPTWIELAGFAAAALMLVVGYRVRRDERRIVSVWQILEHSTEARIGELIQATGFDRPFLLRAVRIINQQPNAYYVWDEASDTIIDGRMRSRVVIIERCESCGAGVNAELSMDLADVPACAHCGGPVTSRDLNRLKQENLSALRAESLRPSQKFTLWIFIVLLLIFWPAALAYALWSTGVLNDLFGRARA